MEELLNSKDLLDEPRVAAACRALMPDQKHPEELSIEIVAFQMYSKLDQFDRLTFLRLVYGRDNDTFILRSLGAEMMIIASVLAWEAKK